MNRTPMFLKVGFFLMLLSGVTALYAWRQITPRGGPAETSYAPGEAIASLKLQAPEFTLTDSLGETFSNRSLAGQVYVVSFFYTTCPGPCLELNNSIHRVRDELGPEVDVTFLSITANPVIDTPEQLSEYGRQYDADFERWRFLTGPAEKIASIADEFKVGVDVNGDSGNPQHPITHTDRLIVVDPSGTVVGMYQALDPAQVRMLKRKLRSLAAAG